jgi:signal peptidase I
VRIAPTAHNQESNPGLLMLLSRKNLAAAAAILALLLAVRLGSFQGLVRPVRIAGASMAETLRGGHFQLPCGDCGFPCRYDAQRPPTKSRVVCPNCGHGNRDLERAERLPGQRVLVDRLAYRYHAPRRWDVIAMRSHDDPDYSEVKRVVGLPGERISIRQGDIYVDGQIARKTLPQFRDTAVLVHDSGFEPRRTRDLPARWQATTDSPWNRIARGFSCSSTVPRGTEADWLTYHHWRCFASPLPRSDEYAVLDNYGYNQDESRQLHRVRDLLLVAHLRLGDEVVGGGGSITLRGYDGHAWCRAVLEFPARRASLWRGGDWVTSATLPPAAYARHARLEFALFDRQVILAVDRRVVLAWQNDGAAGGGDENRAPEVTASSHSFGIATDGLTVSIGRLQVFRDVYYLDPRGLGRDWAAATPLGSDEVLVLGDNVPVSRDSRHWEQPGVPVERILGPVIRLGE